MGMVELQEAEKKLLELKELVNKLEDLQTKMKNESDTDKFISYYEKEFDTLLKMSGCYHDIINLTNEIKDKDLIFLKKKLIKDTEALYNPIVFER